MKTRYQSRALLPAAASVVVALAIVGSSVHAQSGGRPLVAADFVQSSPRGFGDRNNSWAQAMVWWKNHLYVGTSRQTLCSSLYAVWQFATLTFGREFADTWLHYPRPDPDLACAADGADLSLRAEIWRWTPATDTWLRVFQSPADLDHPGATAVFPAQAGKKVPYEIAFRGMNPHKEPDGTEALYAFGVNSTIMWDRTKLPPPRILRSTDGVTFEPIPQTPGTFLGDLPFNPDHSSFRSPVSFRGKLFVLSGPVFGQGTLVGSADPAKGNDAWFLASPPQMVFYEMAEFNGWLYLGTLNVFGGYSVVKTRATGTPPYTFTTVVPAGAYLLNRPSKSVVSMHTYKGRLYVGTGTQTELIRINPDDTWDLVVGEPRLVPLATGGLEWKYPISGLDAGFGHSLNDHAWQMDDAFKFLYIGTYNSSIAFKDDPVYGPLLRHNMGAHLYRSAEGWYYSPVTTNGFTNPSDALGGRFDYGIRTMTLTPHGAFLGTANDHYGTTVFRGRLRTSKDLDIPDRVEIEPTRSGAALLSWDKPRRGVIVRIFRALIHNVLIRDEVNFEAWTFPTGNKIPDTYVGPYEQIAATDKDMFIDTSVQRGKRYMYYVVVETQAGVHSEPSNLVTFPLLTPPVTFASLLTEIDRVDRRQRYSNRQLGMTRPRLMLATAWAAAARCDIAGALNVLNPTKAAADAVQPEATDIEVLISKLVRRLTVYRQFPQDVSSGEFCIGS